jgi:O-antigen ligase
MQLSTSKNLSFKYLINLLLSFLPLSFIAGNLIINLNVVLIILLSIFFYGKKIFTVKFFFLDKLLVLFFLFSLIIGIINTFNVFQIDNFNQDFNILNKSLFFLRYLLFYFVIKLLIEEEIFNFKLFFISASICSIFVCLDLILQLLSGKDIFGNLKTPRKLSGPFGDELIAGSYLQRFSIFIFFFFAAQIKIKNKNFLIIILVLFFSLVFFSLVIAGNRMPLVLFVLMFSILFLTEKKLRNYSAIFIPFLLIIFALIFNLNQEVEDNTRHFLQMVNQLFLFFFEILSQNTNSNVRYAYINNTYVNEFFSGYLTWQQNFFIGGGIDSYYLNCIEVSKHCASHPHNYYLEILSELGILGFILTLIIFIRILKVALSKKNYLNIIFEKNLIAPFFLLFIVEIFPIKTSGSFFTTGNSTFLFFIIAVIIGLSNKSKYN